MLHFCAALAKRVSPLALAISAYINAERAGGGLSNFALSIHTETSRGQEGEEEAASEPALCSELLQGPCGLQGGRDGGTKSLKEGVIRTLVEVACTVATEQGGITGFNKWRLTCCKTPLISLKINNLESKEYIAYLCHGNTLCRQKLGQCLCLPGLATDLGGVAAPLPAWWVHQRKAPCGTLLGWSFGVWPQEEISSGCTVFAVSTLNEFWPSV